MKFLILALKISTSIKVIFCFFFINNYNDNVNVIVKNVKKFKNNAGAVKKRNDLVVKKKNEKNLFIRSFFSVKV